MGVVRYASTVASFLASYDNWRILLAEINKRAYLRTYLAQHTHKDQLRSLHHGVRWLLRSIEQGTDPGSGTYYFAKGWTSSYPETTGYIIPSLLRYSRSAQAETQWAKESEAAALSAGQWLLSIQNADGGWPGGYVHQKRPSVVFNTGQILRGMLALYERTHDEVWKRSAHRAIDWIWQQLNEQGQFASNDFMSAIRVYGTYVVAPILDWSVHFAEERSHWEALAVRHLDWVLTQQNELGWFANCDNTLHRNDRPIIHTLAYTIDGLWCAGLSLDHPTYREAALLPARVLATAFLQRGILSGRYNAKWEGSEAFIPTGGAQLAIVWHSMYIHTGEQLWKDARDRMNTLISVIAQRNARESVDSAGGQAGSFPLWGRYEPFALPNWATKYTVDSLLNGLEK